MAPAPSILEILGALLLYSYSFYFVLSGLSYVIVFVALRRRLGVTHVPAPRESLRAIWTSLGGNLGNVLLTAPIHWAILSGRTRVYFSVEEYGVPWLLVSVVLVLVVTETMIYWIHRALHVRWLYARLHRQHHAFRRPTPWVSNAFHPLDSFAQALPHHLCAFMLPLNTWVYHSYVTAVMIWAVMIHDRVCFVGHPLVNHTGCHTAHHWYNKYNYGQFLSVWDRLCRTYKDPRELPDQFFASKPGWRSR